MKILITHGTDRLLDTAAALAGANLYKVIVMTGSFKPERFKGSDAEFNVGLAFGALQVLQRPGVYVAMNGFVSEWSKVRRDSDNGKFFVFY
ncbi:unnamed protein product [Soboliphyme baturini]|uniref:Asparaginase domain-containing protein n=1 Tax=Soboliphyme baturini TaxID=241478 RepID=A0A183IQ29_9BILA|nr:unnamed protein product [Soboliphyme baturini]